MNKLFVFVLTAAIGALVFTALPSAQASSSSVLMKAGFPGVTTSETTTVSNSQNVTDISGPIGLQTIGGVTGQMVTNTPSCQFHILGGEGASCTMPLRGVYRITIKRQGPNLKWIMWKTIYSNAQGQFKTTLQPGVYQLQSHSLTRKFTSGDGDPKVVTVTKGQFTHVELFQDIGIR